MAIAAGHFTWTFTGLGFVMMVLLIFNYFDVRIDQWNQIRKYKIMCHYQYQTLIDFENQMKRFHLKHKRIERIRIEDKISRSWLVQGTDENHNKFIDTIIRIFPLKDLSIEIH